MEQTDADAERHVFVLFCFFQGLFWKPLKTSPRRLYIIRMCTLFFEHRASLRDSSTFALENCDCPCRPKPRRSAAKLSIQLTARGAPLTLLVPKCYPGSCQQSAFLLSPLPSLHKTQLYTFLCWTALHTTNSRLFATVFSIELRQSVSSTKVSILVMGVVKGDHGSRLKQVISEKPNWQD